MPTFIVDTIQTIKRSYIISGDTADVAGIKVLSEKDGILTSEEGTEQVVKVSSVTIGVPSSIEQYDPRMLPSIVKEHSIDLKNYLMNQGLIEHDNLLVTYHPNKLLIEILCESDHIIKTVKRFIPDDKWYICDIKYNLKSNVI